MFHGEASRRLHVVLASPSRWPGRGEQLLQPPPAVPVPRGCGTRPSAAQEPRELLAPELCSGRPSPARPRGRAVCLGEGGDPQAGGAGHWGLLWACGPHPTQPRQPRPCGGDTSSHLPCCLAGGCCSGLPQAQQESCPRTRRLCRKASPLPGSEPGPSAAPGLVPPAAHSSQAQPQPLEQPWHAPLPIACPEPHIPAAAPACPGTPAPAPSRRLRGAGGRGRVWGAFICAAIQRDLLALRGFSRQDPAAVPAGFGARKLPVLAQPNGVSIKRAAVRFRAPQRAAAIAGVALGGVNCCFVTSVGRWLRQMPLLPAPLPQGHAAAPARRGPVGPAACGPGRGAWARLQRGRAWRGCQAAPGPRRSAAPPQVQLEAPVLCLPPPCRPLPRSAAAPPLLLLACCPRAC